MFTQQLIPASVGESAEVDPYNLQVVSSILAWVGPSDTQALKGVKNISGSLIPRYLYKDLQFKRFLFSQKKWPLSWERNLRYNP